MDNTPESSLQTKILSYEWPKRLLTCRGYLWRKAEEKLRWQTTEPKGCTDLLQNRPTTQGAQECPFCTLSLCTSTPSTASLLVTQQAEQWKVRSCCTRTTAAAGPFWPRQISRATSRYLAGFLRFELGSDVLQKMAVTYRLTARLEPISTIMPHDKKRTSSLSFVQISGDNFCILQTEVRKSMTFLKASPLKPAGHVKRRQQPGSQQCESLTYTVRTYVCTWEHGSCLELCLCAFLLTDILEEHSGHHCTISGTQSQKPVFIGDTYTLFCIPPCLWYNTAQD